MARNPGELEFLRANPSVPRVGRGLACNSGITASSGSPQLFRTGKRGSPTALLWGCSMFAVVNREPRTENREPRTENRELRTKN
jgi:hypothetical protein